MKTSISSIFAAAGVLLLVSAGASPESWYPGLQAIAAVACLAISHVLTPCKDQITQWWRRRISRINPHA